jgi:hypothetical protein
VGEEKPLRLVSIRQARLKPLALSASAHERMVNGYSAESGEEMFGFSENLIAPDKGLWPKHCVTLS